MRHNDGWSEALRGWSDLSVWVKNGEMIISGMPPREDEGFPEGTHNCDAMGCGRWHVAARGPVPSVMDATPTERSDSDVTR